MSSQPKLHTLFSREQIAITVDRMASEISSGYAKKNPLILGVLKGSFVFIADLMRRLDFPLQVDFLRLSSYRGTVSAGTIKLVSEPSCQIEGRHVLVLEDIIDTGLTTSFVLEYLAQKQTASIRLATLLDKPARRIVPVKIDYLGLRVPDRFLVGYGLDLDEQYRNLPDICALEER
jgi:hypoxanthine phosphoribosyltransferase